MKETFFLICISLLFCVSSYGQTISGVIQEEETGEPVVFASVILKQDTIVVIGIEADMDGKFIINNVSNGVYSLIVNYVGLKEYNQEIIVNGRDLDLSVKLETKEGMGCGIGPIIEIHPLRNHILSQRSNSIVVNQYSKDMAGTFDDPSRVLMRHTGISTSNDQTNGIVYRGLAPDLMKWSMDGAEIVNPNHLSNAGRFSNVSGVGAGGVLAVPFDVISKFEFKGQPSSSNQLNTISGVSDLSFKDRGNTFIEVGLLGMEAGFQSQGKANIMAQARYSTVGILGDLGLDFDGESIKFQDYFLKAEIAPRFTFTGIYARSTNEKAFEDRPPFESFISDIKIAGLTYKNKVSKHSLYFSNKNDSNNSNDSRTGLSNLSQSKLSYHGESLYKNLDFWWNIIYNKDALGDFESDYLLVQHGMSIKRYIKGKKFDFYLQPSLDFVVDTYWPEFNFEPALLLQLIKGKSIIQFNTSLKSQMQNVYLYRFATEELQRSKSASTSLSYKLNFESQQFLLRSFYNYYYDLPSGGISSPAINGLNNLRFGGLDNIGNARSYGVEFMYDLKLNNGLYLNANVTFFDMKAGNINAVYNFGHTSNLILSKKFDKPNLNFSIAGHFRGGAYDPALFNREFYEMQLGDYYRIDLRAVYTWKQKNILTIDIQNVTNRLNDSYFNVNRIYQDPWADPEFEFTTEKQLGIIPILSYKRIIN